jgi:transcriptional regulator with XRE-family HTH domain
VSVDDLKRAQRAGWIIEGVDEDGMLCRCPSHGCGLRVKMKFGGPIQTCDPGLNRDPRSVPIGSYEDVRVLLRERREDLLLSIPELEEIAGLTKDHIAKAEKENPTRTPGFDLLSVWAQALGYEFVLRPAQLSPLSLRTIVETRQYRGRRLLERARRRRERAR